MFEYSFSYSKLNGKIKELYGSQESFAKHLGISATSLSKKLNGITDFSQKEMLKARELMNLENIDEYFFTQKVKET